MKTVKMDRAFDYRPTKHLMRAYEKNKTYSRVPEAAVAAILKAGAGTIVTSVAQVYDPSGDRPTTTVSNVRVSW